MISPQNTSEVASESFNALICAVGTDVYQYLYTVVLAGVTGGIAALVRMQGRNLTDRPRLCKME